MINIYIYVSLYDHKYTYIYVYVYIYIIYIICIPLSRKERYIQFIYILINKYKEIFITLLTNISIPVR